MAGNNLAEVVLCEQVYSEVILQDGDIRMVAYLLDKGTLNLGTRKILIVEDAMLRVAALAVKVEASILTTVEACAPADKILGRARGILNYKLNCFRVALAGTANQRVLDMFLECVGCIGYRADTALRVVGVTLIKFTLGNESYGCCVGHLEGEAQSCRSGTDNQKITLHFFVMFV